VQAAKPNPTQATPVHKVIFDKPIIKVPGCPPIAEVMTGVITYMLTFDRLPELDRQGRPKMFYGQRIHDKCYRRPHFDAGQFVEAWDDEGARKGYCLYKMGCKGPTTYNACSTVRWNERRVLPDPVRPRLHRLFGRRLLGQGLVLRPRHRHPPVRRRKQCRPGRWRRWSVWWAVRRTSLRPCSRSARNNSRPKTKRAEDHDHGRYETQGFKLDNSGKRVVVDPVTRIEGHMRCEVNLDENNVIRNAVSTGTMWRGLEVILKGRDPRDAWAFTERICGVCTGTHALTSVRAVEDALGIKIPENANSIRNIMQL
jgi:hypothetical protein